MSTMDQGASAPSIKSESTACRASPNASTTSSCTNHQVAVSGANSGDTIRERFRTECLLLSRIRHPNIVQFLGVHYGPNSSDLTLVLEHLHMDLEQCFATYPQMPLSIKLGVLEDVSYDLLHLHTRKPPIFHRDLTASNILVTPDMRAKIADLGVSRLLDTTAKVQFHSLPRNTAVHATRGTKTRTKLRRPIRHLFIWCGCTLRC